MEEETSTAKRIELILAQMAEIAEQQCQRDSRSRKLMKELKDMGIQCSFIAIPEALQKPVSEEQLLLEMANVGSPIDPISDPLLVANIKDEDFITCMANWGMNDPDCK
jgi:hypothetical protein